jgi:hypothetical protein
MWGISMLVIVALAGVVLLGIALAVGAAPLLAMLIFVLAAVAIGVGFAFKRGTQHVKGRDAEVGAGEAPASRPTRARTPDAPKPTGRPVTGEGGDPA